MADSQSCYENTRSLLRDTLVLCLEVEEMSLNIAQSIMISQDVLNRVMFFRKSNRMREFRTNVSLTEDFVVKDIRARQERGE
jgi:hypothetical protein